MNLINTNNAILANLSPSDKKVMENIIMGERIAQMSEKYALQVLSLIVAQTIREAGAKEMTTDMVEFITKRLYEDVCKRYPYLTDREMRYIAEEGIRGNLGQYFGVNVSTFNTWIKEWLDSTKRKEAQRNYNHLHDNQFKRNYTEQEKQQIIQKGYDIAFLRFKESKELPVVCTPYWEEYKRRNGNTLTQKERAELYMEAEMSYRDELKEYKKKNSDYKEPEKKSQCIIFKKVLHKLVLKKVWA